jgi:hypothetical protein
MPFYTGKSFCPVVSHVINAYSVRYISELGKPVVKIYNRVSYKSGHRRKLSATTVV